MKKALQRTLAALMVLALLTGAALAAKAYDLFVYVTADCNVRSGPSLDVPVISTLRQGSEVVFLDRAAIDSRGVTWFCVDAASSEGWVSSVYTNLVDGYGAIGGYINLENVDFVRITGDCNVRISPDLNASVTNTLRKGTLVNYAGTSFIDYRGVRWDFVEFEDAYHEGRDGWVSSVNAQALQMNF